MRSIFFLALIGVAITASTATAQQPQIGDSIAVVSDAADIMAGQQPIAVLTRGQQTSVRNVSGPWLLISFSMQGRPTSGWVHSRDVRVVAQAYQAASYQPTYSAPTQYYTPQTSYYTPNYGYYQNYNYRPSHWYHDTGHWHRHGNHWDYHNTGHWHHDHD